MLQCHALDPPFQGAILLSSAFLGEVTPNTNEITWTTFAAVGCTQPAGPQRLECLKAVPAATIHGFMNGPNAPAAFNALIDKWVVLSRPCIIYSFSVTVFPNPVQRILNRQIARVPLLQGGMKDDGSVFVFGETNVSAFLNAAFGGAITPQEAAPLYPGLSGFPEISQIARDISFVWRAGFLRLILPSADDPCSPASLYTDAYFQIGETNIYRYIYGAFAGMLRPSR